jgi:hypothetical protein
MSTVDVSPGTAATSDPSVHPLLESLVDTAGVFPPAGLSTAEALALHVAAVNGPQGDLVGRMLFPASRLAELVTAAQASLEPDQDVCVALVCDTGVTGLPAALAALEAEPRLVLTAVEAAIPGDPADAATGAAALIEALPDVEGYVEVPRQADWGAVLPVLADSAYGAKLRTGGTTADAFPSDAEVARFIEACVVEELPFKCTAGLHHAVRHTDAETGFEHHGFLNILLATQAATNGLALERVERIVADRDAASLARRVREMDVTDAVVARSFFAAFGSCSVDEPVHDLVELGLLPA